jgi:uncharacterized protein YprB with RNaseH-like and TPR domain/predicted nuclease with RNAse H fold
MTGTKTPAQMSPPRSGGRKRGSSQALGPRHARRRPAGGLSCPEERGGGILSETFVHMAGIGAKTERRLWESGIRNWDALGETALARRHNLTAALEQSKQALSDGNLDYFFTRLPAAERWRAFADFGPEFVALDIETTGLSIYDHVTVIGAESKGEYRTFVRGSNLEEAADFLAEAKGLITFNGALFDVPFIQRTFPDLVLPDAHVDLRFLARRVQLAGSLKTVEQLAELERDSDLEDVSGYEATVLWSRYAFDGSRSALGDLLAYNAADTCVLRPLAELVVDRLYDQLQPGSADDDESIRLFELAGIDDLPRQRRPAAERVEPPRIIAGRTRLTVGRRAFPMPPRAETRPALTIATLRAAMPDPDARIVGIDLTGSETRPSGWALLQGDIVLTGTLSSTEEIVARTLACKPRLVSIDSPLSLPEGRDCTRDDCECRSLGITRHCERVLKRRGVNVYPCLIQSMQALTRRGMQIAEALRSAGVEVIESYPGAAQDIMRIPRKRASQLQLRAGLERFGLRGLRASEAVTHDELDAATSAIVGSFFLAELFEGLGNEQEGHLIIPSLPAESQPPSAEVEFTPASSLLMLLGAGATTEATALTHAAAKNGASPRELLSGSEEDYWTALAEHGPRLRAAMITGVETRLPRRPRFFDLQLRADDPQRRRQLRRWVSRWPA